MNGLLSFLSGKKTYIIAFCMVCYGVAQILQDQFEQGVKTIVEALGLGSLRAGITKSGSG